MNTHKQDWYQTKERRFKRMEQMGKDIQPKGEEMRKRGKSLERPLSRNPWMPKKGIPRRI